MSWNKYLNIASFLIVLSVFLVFKDAVHLSTNLVTFLPHGKSKETFEIYSQFKNAKEVLVAVEGFDKKSLEDSKEIEESLTQSGLLGLESELSPRPSMLSYMQKYPFYTKAFEPKQTDDIAYKIQELYTNITTGAYYTPIDKQDPLGYFKTHTQERGFDAKNAHLALGDFGYLSVFSIKDASNTLENYQRIYELVHEKLKTYSTVRVFSPTFYFVENAKKIKSDVNFLVILSSILLLGLYVLMIKNVALLVNTIATLLSSMMVSFLVLSLLWNEISVFVLAFGGAISTVAIDYMFHHYFHGHYTQKKAFNKSVFYGFLTTASGFFIFSWIDFLLIQQLCLFAVFSLGFSYVHFVFLYPRVGFLKKHSFSSFRFSLPLPYRLIAISSILAIIVVFPFLHVNTDIKSLDYQNESLMEEEAFFKTEMKKNNYMPFMIEADTIEELIERATMTKERFKKAIVPLSYLFGKEFYDKRHQDLSSFDFTQKKKLLQESARLSGFREDFFKDAYDEALLNPSYETPTLANLEAMGLPVVYSKARYFTTALIEQHETEALSAFTFVSVIDSKALFLESLQAISHQLLIGGFVTLCLIFGVLFFTCRKNFAQSASYIVFPSALILIVSMESLSIIHLFMLFIVMSLSIDYGIYMAHAQKEDTETKTAILFSLISTFSGFGILILSKVGALHFMGMVTSVGLGAVFLLLLGRRKSDA